MSLWRILFCTFVVVASANIALADGVFMVVKGDVKVEGPGKAAQPAKVGMKVNTGDKILAGKEGRAKIVMQDKNVLNISPDTKMIIEKYNSNESTGEKNVTLNVLYGKVRSTVNQKYDGDKSKFEIKTPSAVAGVRGTDFLTQFNRSNNQAKFVTFEGSVAVGQADASGKMINPVIVKPGEFSVASTGTPPSPPTAVPKNELASMNQESKADTAKGGDRGVSSDSSKQEGGKKDDKGKDDGKGDKKGEGDKGKGNSENDKKGEGEKKADGDKKEGGDKKAEGDKPKADPNAKGGDGKTGDGKDAGGKPDAKSAGNGNGTGPNGDAKSGNAEGGGNGAGKNGDTRGPASVGAGPDQGPKAPSMIGDIGKELPGEPPPQFIAPEPPPRLADIYKPPEVPQDILQQKTLLIINVNLPQ